MLGLGESEGPLVASSQGPLSQSWCRSPLEEAAVGVRGGGLAWALCGEGVQGGGRVGVGLAGRGQHRPPSLLGRGPRVGWRLCSASDLPLSRWGRAGPPSLFQLLGWFLFAWDLGWPGRCPWPSHGLGSRGVPCLLPSPEPWRVGRPSPGRRVCWSGALPRPALAAGAVPGGRRCVTPASRGSPEQGRGREAPWRWRLGPQRDGDSSGPVQPLHPLRQLQAPVWAALHGSGGLWTPGGALWLHSWGSQGCLGGQGGSAAVRWSHPASALRWPRDVLTYGAQEGWGALVDLPFPCPRPGAEVWGCWGRGRV